MFQRKGEHIYIRGMKIPARYWRLPVFAYMGGVIGIIVGLFFEAVSQTLNQK